jgi:gallate decarboxylase subunit D
LLAAEMSGKKNPPPMAASAGKGRHRVHAAVQFLGSDILLSIWGGTMPHIGSVSITQPRPGISNTRQRSSTSSIYNFTGHKDEAVARYCAEKIAAACDKKTVAVAGIHIDNASSADITAIMKNIDILCERFVRNIGSRK